jgi:hypothetical protein
MHATENNIILNRPPEREPLVSIFKEILACDDLINEVNKRSGVLTQALGDLMKAQGADFSEIEAAAFADLGIK